MRFTANARTVPLSIALIALCPAGAFAKKFCSTLSEIPDLGMTTVNNGVLEHLVVYDLNVSIDVTHPFIGDLTFALSKITGDGAPIGPVPLITHVTGPCSADDIDVVLDDQASIDVNTRCESPLGANGPYRPQGSLGAFKFFNMAGTYSLKVTDDVGQDFGTLNEYCLIFQDSLDVDGDGEIEALTDALLILRWKFGFTGAVLANGAVDLLHCTRCDGNSIRNYLTDLP